MSEQESLNTKTSVKYRVRDNFQDVFLKENAGCIYYFKRQVYLQEELERTARNARTSRHRWMTWGSLVALAWIGCVVRLPPIQQARSVIPHVAMLILGSSIAATIGKNAGNATAAERQAKELGRRLRLCRNGDDLAKLHQESSLFWEKYGHFCSR